MPRPEPPQPPPQPFTWRDGVHVTHTSLWCDAPHPRSLCFVSHGGRPLQGQHQQLLCSQRTQQLLSLGGNKWLGEPLLTPFGRPFTLGPTRLELFPSGYLAGAASLLISGSGEPRVYAGPVNRAAGPTAEPAQVRPAAALVVEAPLAALLAPLPSWDEVSARLRAALASADAADAVPLLLVPPLGVAQEVIRLLAATGVPLCLHPRIHSYLRAYQQLGVPCGLPSAADAPSAPGAPRPLSAGARRPLAPGEVLLWPLPADPAERLTVPPRWVAGGRALYGVLCRGAALDPEDLPRLQRRLGEALPLRAAIAVPDGLDLPGLLAYTRESGARDLYLTAGASDAVARALAAARVRVHALGPPQQLGLF